MKNILTGIRPTGPLHLGHLLGAIQNWVKLQEQYHCYFELADVQGLTDNFENPAKVHDNVREVAMDLLACGIDPHKSTLFIQSMIPEIAELTVFYSNLVTIARLERNPTIKTEIKQKKVLFGEQGESVTYGFLGYPVSQAADITIFDGEIVPAGEDQQPLIEQTREIVRKFNHIYGETFQEPECLFTETPRIKGLDGNEKMGKSLGNAIFLSDSKETITQKIMNAVTDSNKIKKDDPANPFVCMVYYYHNLVNKQNIKTVCTECQNGSRGCVACKRELIEAMLAFLKPIQEKRQTYEKHPEIVEQILKESTESAQKKAKEVMKRVKKQMMINYFEEE